MAGKKEFTPLQAESFPKKCRICGKVYLDQAQFLAQTTPVTHSPSSIREVTQDDGHHDLFLEVFRNCGCGSTLMEFFHSRRDLSEAGITRRQLFDSMVRILEDAGQSRQQARAALLGRLKAFQES